MTVPAEPITQAGKDPRAPVPEWAWNLLVKGFRRKHHTSPPTPNAQSASARCSCTRRDRSSARPAKTRATTSGSSRPRRSMRPGTWPSSAPRSTSPAACPSPVTTTPTVTTTAGGVKSSHHYSEPL